MKKRYGALARSTEKPCRAQAVAVTRVSSPVNAGEEQ